MVRPSAPATDPRPAGPPVVSVVIPCYEQARYLPEAVASVAAQTFDDWEIVIVDDGSPDDTADVAQDLIDRLGPRIRLIRQPNGGVVRARNAGIAAAAGRYILPLDADDRLHPDLLRETVAVLEANPGIAIAYTDFQQFDGADEVKVRPEWDLDRLTEFNLLVTTALFRREAWVATGGYNPNMADGLEDWDFWLSCAERGFTGRRVPRVLFFYRQRAGSRNEQATARLAQLHRQIRANHPALYAPRQRFRRALRRLRRRLAMRIRGPAGSRRH